MDKDDRGALRALGMALTAIVTIAIFSPGSRDPSTSQKSQPHTQGYSDQNGERIEASDFWLNTYAPPKDTLAQWIMALLSLAATGVSIWAVRLVRSTLDETRSATKNSADAIAIAREANVVSREIGEAQVRAYLSISNGAFDFNNPNKITIGTVTVDCENSGQSPAFKVMVELSLVLIKSRPIISASNDPPDQFLCRIPRQILTTLPANQKRQFTFKVPRNHFASEWADLVCSGKAMLALNGSCEWEDVFDRRETVDVIGSEIMESDNYFACSSLPKGQFGVSNLRVAKPRAINPEN